MSCLHLAVKDCEKINDGQNKKQLQLQVFLVSVVCPTLVFGR